MNALYLPWGGLALRVMLNYDIMNMIMTSVLNAICKCWAYWIRSDAAMWEFPDGIGRSGLTIDIHPIASES